MYSSVKLSLVLKCIQINKLCQNAKLQGFLFNLNVFFVKLSLVLKCIQINKLHQNAKFLQGFLFNLNVFFCKTVVGIEMCPNKQIASKCKIFAGISLQLEKVNAIYFNIVLVLQDWLNPYCTDKNSNVFV